jgi:hypothetical protein
MFDLDLNSSHERQGKQAELEQQHLERAITIDEFLEHIGNQDLNSLRYYKDEPSIVELGPINIKRPYYTQESWRYVKDPTDPGKFIDMDHFLANADLHSDTAGIGLLVEIQQLLKRYPSAFAESDYRSNALGSIFGTAYYGPDG